MDQTTEQTAQPDVTQTTTTLTTEQPTETTAALTTPEAPTVDFQSLIPEEYREEKSLQNFNKMDDFVKSYLHSQKMVGLDKIPVPNKHATEEDWKEVYKKLGSPEAADGYKYSLPEDHAVPEDTLKSFSEEAVKLGFLLGTRKMQLHKSLLETGQTYQVEVEELFMDDSGLGAFQCSVTCKDDVIAEAKLSVFETNDENQLLTN